MTVNRMVSILAGFAVLLSLVLAQIGGQINLFQMGFTGFCPAATVFKALGFREAANACGSNAPGKGCC
ncbi:MAG: DUF2892 domain-containing protein [Thiomonas sp.]